MAKTAQSISYFKESLAGAFNLSKHPRRKFAIFALIILAILAATSLALESSGLGGNCNIALSQQRFACLKSMASKTGNYTYCTKISSNAIEDQCISSVAVAAKNLSGCAMVKNSNQYYIQCVESVAYSTGNNSDCRLLDWQNSSTCYYSMAQSANFSSISYCNPIQNGSSRSLCDSEHYYYAALVTGNYTACSMLTNSSNSTLLYDLAYHGPRQPEFGILPYQYDGASPRDYCYIQIKNTTNSTLPCSYISNSTLRQSCIGQNDTQIASNLSSENVTSLCTNTQYPQLSDLCLFSIYASAAKASKNVTTCDLIGNQTYENECIINLATSYNQSSYCSYLHNFTEKNSCIQEVELNEGNYT